MVRENCCGWNGPILLGQDPADQMCHKLCLGKWNGKLLKSATSQCANDIMDCNLLEHVLNFMRPVDSIHKLEGALK